MMRVRISSRIQLVPTQQWADRDSTRNRKHGNPLNANQSQRLRKQVRRRAIRTATSWQCEPQRWLGKPHTNVRRVEPAMGRDHGGQKHLGQDHAVDHQDRANNDRNKKTNRSFSTQIRSRRRRCGSQPQVRRENAGIRNAASELRAAKPAAATSESQ